FLTKLKAAEIVAGKGRVHTIRASVLVVAALPILSIPILLGGVTGWDFLRAAMVHGSILMLAIASGLLASSLSRQWAGAMVVAISLFARSEEHTSELQSRL